MQTILYFAFILLMCGLTGWLAFYAWRQQRVPGARAYAALAFGECLLALSEMLSMLSPGPAQALFWFNTRFIFTAAIPVLFLVFALQYQGHKEWLSRRLIATAFIIPVLTQFILWSNSLHGLWVKQEVSFYQSGPFWLSETSARIPGLWFLVHSFYSLLLLLAGIVVILVTAWSKPRVLYRGQTLLLTSGALIALVATLFPTFNLVPPGGINPFIPGVGASALFYALAIFRFHFLKRSPAMKTKPQATPLRVQENRSLALFLLIFLLLVAGISAIGYLSYKNYEDQFRAQVEGQLSSVGTLKANELQNWRSERLADAEIFYKNSAFSALAQRFLANPPDAPAQGELQAWLKVFNDNKQYDRVFLLDTGGVERISSPATTEPVAEHLAQEVTAGLRAGQVTFVDFYRDTNGGPIHLALLVPIMANQDNHPLGLLVLRIDPQVYLYPFIQQWPVPSASAETLLVRRDGEDVLFLNTLRFQLDTALNLRMPLASTEVLAVKAVLGQAGTVEGIDYRGVAVIGDVRAVPGSPWFLVSRIDAAEVYAPLRERLWQTIAFFGALILAAGAGLALVWRQQQVRFYRASHKAAEAQRQLSERQQALLSAIPDIIMEVDLNKVYTWANQAGIEYFGEDVIGKEAAFYFEGEQDTYGVVQPLFNGDEKVIYVESWQRRMDGKKRLLAWWCRDLKDERGNVTGALSSARDITQGKQQEAQILAAQAELQALLAKADQARRALLTVVEDQKLAEEENRRLNAQLEQRVADRTAQLETSNKELEAFAYSVSHDLRAPLRAIDGFSRILQNEYAQKLDDEGLRLLGVVRNSTKMMDHLITDILALSRVGRSELRYSPIDMTTLANSIYHELAPPEVLEKFVFRVSDLPRASGDPTLIRQVWANLISNAIKYTLPIADPAVFGGKRECVIEINGWEKDGLCTYSIKDSGVGFNPKYADKLFGLFQRLHKAGEFEGTGVGLAIVQRIIHRHGGQAWGEGQVDAGATFYFTLPERQKDHE